MARIEMQGAEMAPTPSVATNGDFFFELGLTYATGRDGRADLIEAHKWFNLAAMQGHDEAGRFRQDIAVDMSRSDIAEAQRAARDWLAIH